MTPQTHGSNNLADCVDPVQREYLFDATLGSSLLLHTIVAVPNLVWALFVKQKANSIKE